MFHVEHYRSVLTAPRSPLLHLPCDLQLNLIRNHNKDVPPLGQLPQQEDSASDAEEEVNDGSPVSGASELCPAPQIAAAQLLSTT